MHSYCSNSIIIMFVTLSRYIIIINHICKVQECLAEIAVWQPV